MTFRLGVSSNIVSPTLLWESGEGSFKSDLVSWSDLTTMTQQNLFFDLKTDNSLTMNNATNQTRPFTVCQKPFNRTFCVDLPSLTLGMSSLGIGFIGNQIQSSSSMSSFNCMQYCKAVPANVSFDKLHQQMFQFWHFHFINKLHVLEWMMYPK